MTVNTSYQQELRIPEPEFFILLVDRRGQKLMAAFYHTDQGSDEPRVRSDHATAGLFDVTTSGAKGDGKADSTKLYIYIASWFSDDHHDDDDDDDQIPTCLWWMAFLSAWRDACNHPGKSTLLIPPGIFYVGPLLFDGPCHHNQSPKMVIRGTLRAPSDVS
ncbi:hypothetical protein Ancab_016307, partial [Ancistrocladus abbreviatus]